MLTTNYLIKYINIEQKKIDDIFDENSSATNQLTSPTISPTTSMIISPPPSPETSPETSPTPNNTIILNTKFNDILCNSIENDKTIESYYIASSTNNKSSIFTFFNSVLSSMDNTFYMLNENSKLLEIREFIKVLNTALFEQDLYKKYYYRNRKFRKNKFIELLNNALNFKTEYTMFYMIKQYIADYIGINIFVLNDVECEYYLTNKHEFEKSPWIFVYYNNDIYYPTFFDKKENNIIYGNSEDDYIIKNLYSKYNINRSIVDNNMKQNIIDTKKYNSMSLDKLQEYADKFNIDMKKKSAKTDKMINKTKNELIEELLDYI